METEPSHQPDELGADLPIQFSGQSSAVATAQFPDRSADQRAIPVVFDEQSGLLRRDGRSEEHTSELQSLRHLVCRLLLEKKKKKSKNDHKHDVTRIKQRELNSLH